MNDLPRETSALLGTAIGDALGLPYEGLSSRTIARRRPSVDRYGLFAGVGWVSDDTEQSALVALSLLRADGDLDRFVKRFRKSLLGWFARLPWGIGLATLRACARIALGLRRSGVRSAGNGAAMRAAIVGVYLRDDADARRRWSDALAEVTHLDPRAVSGARYVAEVAALCAKGDDPDPAEACAQALAVVDEVSMRDALARALAFEGDAVAAGEALGNSGFVMHSVPLAAWCFARAGRDLSRALALAISAGGDTDSNGAIVGAWCGARGDALPAALVDRLSPGPFGLAHLRALGAALDARRRGAAVDLSACEYSATAALARNLALYPVIIGHAFRRLWPW